MLHRWRLQPPAEGTKLCAQADVKRPATGIHPRDDPAPLAGTAPLYRTELLQIPRIPGSGVRWGA